VLAHEAGHVLLNAFHTTFDDNPDPNVSHEVDNFGNEYDNDDNLAFSEWMAAFSRAPDHMHKRISDDPLTVEFFVVKSGVSTIKSVRRVLGGSNESAVERFVNTSKFVYEPLRKLQAAPEANL